MLTPEIANEIRSQWQEANRMDSSPIRQFEAQIRAALLITKTQVGIAGAGKSQWDFADGMAQAIMATPSGAVGDGQYDASYLRLIQGMWASYMEWLYTPITVTVNGQTVNLGKRPLDLIMSTPTLATAPAPEEGA